MSNKERISVSVDPEVAEYLENLNNRSAYINEQVKEDMARSGTSERERLENKLEDINEQIDEHEEELKKLRNQRDMVKDKLADLKDQEQAQRERVYDALAKIKGMKPTERDEDSVAVKDAAEAAGMPPEKLLTLAEDIDLGHYRQGGLPDDINDDEKERTDEWIETNL